MHYFIDSNICLYCHEKAIKFIVAKSGDCIDCGQLCPENAYCCNIPNRHKPLKIFYEN